MLLAGSLCHKDSRLQCRERSYYRRPDAIKTQRDRTELEVCSENPGVRARRGLCALPPRREERRSPPCPARPDLSPAWPRAQPGTASRLACPGDQRGEARWDCGLWGLRTSDSPDYSDCNVLQDITSLLTNLREDQAGPTEVLEEINEDIRRSEERLGGGDIISVVELLDTAVSLQQARTGQEEERLEDSSSFLAASLETVNNLGEINISLYTRVK